MQIETSSYLVRHSDEKDIAYMTITAIVVIEKGSLTRT